MSYTGKLYPGTAAPIMQVNVDGSLKTSGSKATYSACVGPFTPGTTPQDVFTITGAANTVVKVLAVTISTIQTTAGNNAWYLVKRSTANTGGTSASVTVVPNDGNDAAAGATVLKYTANPIAGTTVGTVWSGYVNSPAAATAGVGGLVGTEIEFNEDFGKPIVLRSATDVLAVNFNGAALPAGLSVIVGVQWTEESST